MKYCNTGDQRLWVRKAGVHVDPGEVFESPVPLNNSAFEEVKDKKPGIPAPAKE
jgi:hypothetical protein